MIDIDTLEALARNVAAIGRPVAANPADIIALIEEVRALREDAERYRWLRDQNASYMSRWSVDREYEWVGEDLDAAVETARNKEKA